MSESWTPAKSGLDVGINGLTLNDVSDDTKAVATYLHQSEPPERPLVTPIYHSSTYKTPSVDRYVDIAKKGGYFYSRYGNPTVESAECAINALEGGAGSMLFSSGMAAVSTALLGLLKAGDHIIACLPLYSGTHSFLTKILPSFNIETSWVECGSPVEEYRKLIKPNTKVLYGETPCNPTISILDLEAFGSLGRSLPNVATVVDVTYATPYLVQPIKYGVDVAVHSATKYLGGHTDLLGGVLTTRTLDMWKQLYFFRTSLGNNSSPFDAALINRGVKTLPIRMERHCTTAMRLAEYLEKHPKVERVHYPGLTSHPGHQTAKKQMRMFGGMIAFEMKEGLEAGKKMVESVKLIQLAVSLGAPESLIEHPATMTHGPIVMDDAERAEAKITPGLIRISVGLENAEDLIRDLEQALNA